MAETMASMQAFLRTEIGQFIIFAVAALLFLMVSGFMFKRAKMSIKALTYSSLAMSLAFLLSFVTIHSMPQGGSVTLMSMFVLSLVGFWFGPGIGITAGFSYGLLQTIQGVWIIHPIQFLLDYPLAFAALGLSGFFRNRKYGMHIGFFVAATGRFILSTIAGFYWLSGGFREVLWASAVYNFGYIYIEVLGTLIIISFPVVINALNQIKDSANMPSSRT